MSTGCKDLQSVHEVVELQAKHPHTARTAILQEHLYQQVLSGISSDTWIILAVLQISCKGVQARGPAIGFRRKVLT